MAPSNPITYTATRATNDTTHVVVGGNTTTIPMPIMAFSAAIHDWRSGVLVQDAFPTLNPDQREFIMTGLLPDQWDTLFKESQ